MRSRFLKKRVFVAVFLALVGLGVSNVSRVGTVEASPEVRAKPVERPAGPLQVMVLNVRHGFPRFEHLKARLDRIATEITEQSPDLVLLQEVPWTRQVGDGVEYLSRGMGLNHVSVRDNGNRWLLGFDTSLAILSRYPLSDPEVVELRPEAGFFENRLALRARVQTERGPVLAVVTHLTHGDDQTNRRQVRSLAEWVSGSPPGLTLVGGDFNAVPESPQMQFLADRWTDTFRAANREGGGFTCCVGDVREAAQPHSRRIDYLFVVPDARFDASVRSSRRVLTKPFRWNGAPLWASDHAGLVSEIDWFRRPLKTDSFSS